MLLDLNLLLLYKKKFSLYKNFTYLTKLCCPQNYNLLKFFEGQESKEKNFK